jgi:hypothetical protein
MPFFAALVIAASTLATPSVAAAQTTTGTTMQGVMAPSTWSLGVMGGVTISSIDVNDDFDDTDLGTVVGAQAGLFATRPVNENFGLRIEALVTQRGARNELSDTTMRIAYLDVPLLVRWGSMTTDATHFHVFGGVVPSFKLTVSTTDDIGVLSSDITDEVKPMDLGLLIGAGVDRGAWSIDGRYNFGLTNVNDRDDLAEYRNRQFSVNVGYRFR